MPAYSASGLLGFRFSHTQCLGQFLDLPNRQLLGSDARIVPKFRQNLIYLRFFQTSFHRTDNHAAKKLASVKEQRPYGLMKMPKLCKGISTLGSKIEFQNG